MQIAACRQFKYKVTKSLSSGKVRHLGKVTCSHSWTMQDLGTIPRPDSHSWVWTTGQANVVWNYCMMAAYLCCVKMGLFHVSRLNSLTLLSSFPVPLAPEARITWFQFSILRARMDYSKVSILKTSSWLFTHTGAMQRQCRWCFGTKNKVC